MSHNKLFEEDSDEDDVNFKTENEYAKKYDAWREKEEIYKLEQKYGSKVLNSDASVSSDSEDESDEPLEVSEEMETQFLKTLSLLKTKDPRIYDPNYKFFEDSEGKEEEKKSKPTTISFADSDSDDDDSDGEIFTVEKRASDMKAQREKQATVDEENETNVKTSKKDKLKNYLSGKAEHIDEEVEQDLAPLKALWSDPKLNDGEAFLRDYILNKRYLEEGDAGEAGDRILDDEDLEADGKIVEEQGKFERAYNFRFEEPDEEYLKRFPRTMNYIRPKDDRRARKRAEVRARKEEEKKKKMEEIARLKALKLKEIQEKIAKIKEVTGNQDLAFKEEDIEGDFDPEEHDRRMRALFDNEYYGDADDEKPVFPELDEELEIENWEKYEEEYVEEKTEQVDQDGPHCEDEDFNMDADYDPKKARLILMEEMKRNMGKKRRNRKKKSKLAEILSTDKPKFVLTVADKTYAEYMEEYYKMDCEDVIGGDLPTRFKYREVVPNDYGLTVEEILLADDKELTQWVPIKKIVKHRPYHVQKSEVNTYAQKAADVRLKRKILPSLFKDLPQEPDIAVSVEQSSKKKKKKKKIKNVDKSEDNVERIEENDLSEVQDNHNNGEINVDEVSEEKPKKKKKHKQVNGDDSNLITINNNTVNGENNEINNEEIKKKKKKMKHRDEGFIVETVQNEEPSHESSLIEDEFKKKKRKNNIVKENENSQKYNLKRKHLEENDNSQQPNKKKKRKSKLNKDSSNNVDSAKDQNMKKGFKTKFKQKDKFKNKSNRDKSSDNSLNELSDERLKAYGLNPKKYRSFLKYKKF